MFILAMVTLLVATIIQKLTGMGFALVATPVLVLVYGPTNGVLLVILSGMLISVLMAASGFKRIAWKPTVFLILGGLVTAPLGAWVAHKLSEPVLLIVVGCAALIALVSPFVRIGTPRTAGNGSAVLNGAVAGFLHVTSGLSGPPLVAYGSKSKWEYVSFVASLQVIFIVFGLVTFALRGLPTIPLNYTTWITVALVIGYVAGILIEKVVPTVWARRGMFACAWTGAIVVLVRGVFEVFPVRA